MQRRLNVAGSYRITGALKSHMSQDLVDCSGTTPSGRRSRWAKLAVFPSQGPCEGRPTSILIWEHEGQDPGDPSKTYEYNTLDMVRVTGGKIQGHRGIAMKILHLLTADAIPRKP
jgi:hypothetical protein